MFTINLRANETQYRGEGETISEALDSLKLHFVTLKTKGILFISNGKATVDQTFNLFQLRRLFMNSLLRKNFDNLTNERLAIEENKTLYETEEIQGRSYVAKKRGRPKKIVQEPKKRGRPKKI